MEHSHGLHLLLLVFNHLGLKINKTNFCLNRDIKNNFDKYVNIAFELENRFDNIIATYTTDVLTKDISKKIVVEADDEMFSVEFGAKKGDVISLSTSLLKRILKGYFIKTDQMTLNMKLHYLMII